MAYFQQKDKAPEETPERRFYQPVEDDDPYDELGDELPGDIPAEFPDALTYEEELAEQRKDRFRLAAGLFDLLAVVAGAVVILVLVAVLVSLINWVHADIIQSFTLWQTRIR